MQIKRSVTVGCDTSFRCRSIWKNLPVTGSICVLACWKAAGGTL